jgi:hypothetical protein
MTVLGGSEVTAGVAILVVAMFIFLALRRRGRRIGEADPSALFMSLVPVSVLFLFVVGVMLILHGFGIA